MLHEVFSKKMLICFLTGYSAGLPLLITLSLLQAWMKDMQVDLTKIGLITLVGNPYSLKFLWAPVFDRFALPFLGRRRGWLLITQLLLIASIALLGMFNPKSAIWTVSVVALMVAFFSASQDIVIDAFRREYLDDDELAFGSTLYVYGYRIGMLVVSSGGLILADFMPWKMVFMVMGLCMLPGVLTTLWAPEPQLTEAVPTNFKETVLDPFIEFFKRDGALLILGFILLYKVGDTMASAMTMPFYLDIGFTKTEVGVVAKGAGLFAILIGMGIGGVLTLRFGIVKSLYIFGVLQSVSTAGFAVLAKVGHGLPLLSAVIGFENFTGGMGTAAYMAYMATQTNKKFTATQYALLTSLMGVPRTILSAPTGYMAKSMGWAPFFTFCALIAVPGMFLLWKLAPWSTVISPAKSVAVEPEV